MKSEMCLKIHELGGFLREDLNFLFKFCQSVYVWWKRRPSAGGFSTCTCNFGKKIQTNIVNGPQLRHRRQRRKDGGGDNEP
jgi:hypothetical protein